jgi:sugar/nucleoside kinase (ribokinase family)
MECWAGFARSTLHLSQSRHLHLARYFLQESLSKDVPVLFDLAHQAGTPDLGKAIQQLVSQVNILVVKLGKHGAILQHGEMTARLDAIPVKIVDTVGAGDSFAAGFLFDSLSGWSLEHALGLAVACGSLSTSRAGGIDGQPTLQEALSVVNQFG